MMTLSAPDVLDANGESTGGGDVMMTADGNIGVVDGLEALRQRVTQRLRFWFNEWFLDYEDGVPYINDIFERPIPIGLASTIIVEHILRIDEVERVSDVVTNFDLSERTLSWSARVHARSGGSVEASVEI